MFGLFAHHIEQERSPQRTGQHALANRQRTFCLTPFQRKLNGGLQQNGLRHDVIDQTGFQRLTGTQLFTG